MFKLPKLFARHGVKSAERMNSLATVISGTDFANTPEFASKLFDEIDKMAVFEVKYYSVKRARMSFVSRSLRVGMWLAGGLGVVFPLIATYATAYKDICVLLASISLAVAAACAAANARFGGTIGHTRFVIAQLQIEAKITEHRLAWVELMSSAPPTNMTTIVQALRAYRSSVTEIVQNETETWAKYILETSTSSDEPSNKKQGYVDRRETVASAPQ